jgi:hypothetical protein
MTCTEGPFHPAYKAASYLRSKTGQLPAASTAPTCLILNSTLPHLCIKLPLHHLLLYYRAPGVKPCCALMCLGSSLLQWYLGVGCPQFPHAPPLTASCPTCASSCLCVTRCCSAGVSLSLNPPSYCPAPSHATSPSWLQQHAGPTC